MLTRVLSFPWSRLKVRSSFLRSLAKGAGVYTAINTRYSPVSAHHSLFKVLPDYQPAKGSKGNLWSEPFNVTPSLIVGEVRFSLLLCFCASPWCWDAGKTFIFCALLWEHRHVFLFSVKNTIFSKIIVFIGISFGLLQISFCSVLLELELWNVELTLKRKGQRIY